MAIAYTLAEAGKEIGYSERTIRRLAAQGELIVHYIGEKNTQPRILHEELVAYIKRQPTEPPVR